MNYLRRAITAERNRLLKLSPISIVHHQHASFSTTAKTKSTVRTLKFSKNRLPPPPSSKTTSDAVVKEPVTWPKPSEIPWQSKVINSVNLIGQVKIPVQFEESSDGKSWAGTIISQDEGSESSGSLTSFWIPVIFEGDLAHIAMCHLKEKDYVHVNGHLSVDVPSFKLGEVQANVQVMAHSINFVQKSQSKLISMSGELDMGATKNSAVLENNSFSQQSLKAPDSIYMQQDTLSKKSTWDLPIEKENNAKLLDDSKSSPARNSKVDKQSVNASWRDLLTNSKLWVDNREKKSKGLVKPKYPDFTHKDTRVGLWLNTAPVGVLQGLGQLEFFGSTNKAEKGGDSWKHLIENPNTEKGGESWKHLIENTNTEKGGDSWKHLIENPNKWWDNRLDKKNVKGPDFKSKDSGKALWLSDAPAWVLSSLPPLKAKTVDVNTKKKWASY